MKIPITKQYIFLEGESSETTTIQYLDAGKATEAATFQVYADNIVASNITFKVNRLLDLYRALSFCLIFQSMMTNETLFMGNVRAEQLQYLERVRK